MIGFSTGEPTLEGRYVAYAPCEALQVREWLEPEIATWHGGKWHSHRPVWAWIGPLPVIHGNEVTARLKEAVEEICTCQRFPTHCANDCPLHGEIEPLEYDL